MHLADLDYLSINGKSIFHKAKSVSKVIFAVLIIASFILSHDIIKLGILLAVMVSLYILAGIPLGRIGHLALYPAFFSMLFALILSQGEWIVGLTIIFKAVGAALCMIFLLATTPYTDLFSFLALFMPGLLTDVFLFTYRSLFIILDRAGNLIKIVRLRGGYSPSALLLNLTNAAKMLGVLILHSFAMGERMYQVYRLRGYDSFIPLETDI